VKRDEVVEFPPHATHKNEHTTAVVKTEARDAMTRTSRADASS
jgi:hypothetical protein